MTFGAGVAADGRIRRASHEDDPADRAGRKRESGRAAARYGAGQVRHDTGRQAQPPPGTYGHRQARTAGAHGRGQARPRAGAHLFLLPANREATVPQHRPGRRGRNKYPDGVLRIPLCRYSLIPPGGFADTPGGFNLQRGPLRPARRCRSSGGSRWASRALLLAAGIARPLRFSYRGQAHHKCSNDRLQRAHLRRIEYEAKESQP
jgi:hypothetical protein